MSMQFSWLVVPLVIPVLVAVPTVVVISRNLDDPRLSVVPPLVLIVSVAVWSLFDATRFSVTSLEWKLVLYRGYLLAGSVVGLSLFLFAADYTKRSEWRRPTRLAGLSLPLVAINLLAMTNYGSLTVETATTVRVAGTVFADVTWGPVFYVAHAFVYLLIGAAAFMFLTFETTNRHYRGQIRSILGALVLPWGLNVAYLAGITTANLTTVGFALALPIGVLMVFRYRILRLVPVTRSSVVDAMDTGYLVLDRTGVAVDVNDRAAELLETDTDRLLGRHRTAIAAEFPEIDAAFRDGDEFETIAHDADGERRYYNVEASAFETDGSDRDPIGDATLSDDASAVVLIQDVTELVLAQRKLREQKEQVDEQNERLEEFASILSHDLRNPLAVADGRLTLARDERDSDHLRKVAEAHDRMDELIEDALSLARQGQTVVDREPVSLPALARSAWENVDTADATLVVETDRTVDADESQLSQAFENLFRNAVEHGGPDATVTVGDTADGFFVADDGPGIPADERAHVFEKGFTTADQGTGFGLPIVQTCAAAHGWTVDVAESSESGARFEFRVDTETDEAVVTGLTDPEQS